MKRQKSNPFGDITWPTLGKQNVQAKEVYRELKQRRDDDDDDDHENATKQ